MFYKLIVCFAKTYFLPYSFLCVVAYIGGFRDIDSSRAPGITSDFYGPMNVHRGTVLLFGSQEPNIRGVMRLVPEQKM